MDDPSKEIFIERDGDCFKFVLDYLRDNGHVILPITNPRAAFLIELLYYGIEPVDGSKVHCDLTYAAQSLACMEEEIKSWRIKILISTLAEYCASQYLQS